MPEKKFLRRTWDRYAKLGKGRKKKQIWRKPRGRDNKMREKRKGYPSVVSIGYKKNKKNNREILLVNNIRALEKIGKKSLIQLGRIGRKKKIEIIKRAKEKGISIRGVNMDEFIKKNEKKIIKSEKKETKIKNESK